MIDLVFATGNAHKLIEVRSILDLPQYNLLSLKDINFHDDIEETANTLEGNALIKSRTIHRLYGGHVFSEDTGLEVFALNNEPGVYSARYAGEHKNSNDNMDLLLQNLKSKTDRRARFRTVAALIFNDKEYLFEGEVNGHIAHEKSGNQGFGYDPIFIPDGYLKSFADLPNTIKNVISHRYNAVIKVSQFLKEQCSNDLMN